MKMENDKANIFVNHVQGHLNKDDKVHCKICHKNIDEIYKIKINSEYGKLMSKKIRQYKTGDLVEYKSYKGIDEKEHGIKIGMIKGTRRDAWYCIQNHVDIDSEIIAIKDIVRLITPRENLKDWWFYFNYNSPVKK